MTANLAISGVAMALAVFFAFGLGHWCGALRNETRWRDDMVKRGHAMHHWENGKWYWNEDMPPPPKDPAATNVKFGSGSPFRGIGSGT